MTGEVPPKESDEQPENETVAVPRDALVDHAIFYAVECGDIDAHVPDGCDDWSLRDMNVDAVDIDGETVVVHGVTGGTVSEKVRHATYFQPAEYEVHEVPIFVTIHFDMGAHDGEGAASVEVHAESDPLAPPEPDVDAHRYDL